MYECVSSAEGERVHACLGGRTLHVLCVLVCLCARVYVCIQMSVYL